MWRDDPSQTIKYYQLKTVTYGTTSAPYLATKCLQQLARENEDRYSLGASNLKTNFYMDDEMCGSNSLVEAIDIQRQLREILKSAGFHLRKWCSNNPKVLQDVPESDLALQLELDGISEGHVKTLGMTWHPRSDEFTH